MCACTEPVMTGIGAVCVDYGRPKWPITMLSHTHIPGTEKCFFFFFLAPHARTTRYEKAFFSLENQGKKSLLHSRASLDRFLWEQKVAKKVKVFWQLLVGNFGQ